MNNTPRIFFQMHIFSASYLQKRNRSRRSDRLANLGMDGLNNGHLLASMLMRWNCIRTVVSRRSPSLWYSKMVRSVVFLWSFTLAVLCSKFGLNQNTALASRRSTPHAKLVCGLLWGEMAGGRVSEEHHVTQKS